MLSLPGRTRRAPGLLRPGSGSSVGVGLVVGLGVDDGGMVGNAVGGGSFGIAASVAWTPAAIVASMFGVTAGAGR